MGRPWERQRQQLQGEMHAMGCGAREMGRGEARGAQDGRPLIGLAGAGLVTPYSGLGSACPCPWADRAALPQRRPGPGFGQDFPCVPSAGCPRASSHFHWPVPVQAAFRPCAAPVGIGGQADSTLAQVVAEEPQEPAYQLGPAVSLYGGFDTP